MSEHLTRKELKQDKIRESLEHGAEAVLGHKQMVSVIVVAAAIVILGVAAWRFYSERQVVKAGAALDEAMKIYAAPIRTPGEPVEPGELAYVDEKTKLEDALKKFQQAAEKYSRTDPGRLARYYAALSLEDLGRMNQALENLRALENSSDKELAGLAKFQVALINAKTGKTDEAVKTYRALAEKPTTLVPKPLVLIELARQLARGNPQEAAKIYNQIKKDYPDSLLSEEADRGLEALAPKS